MTLSLYVACCQGKLKIKIIVNSLLINPSCQIILVPLLISPPPFQGKKVNKLPFLFSPPSPPLFVTMKYISDTLYKIIWTLILHVDWSSMAYSFAGSLDLFLIFRCITSNILVVKICLFAFQFLMENWYCHLCLIKSSLPLWGFRYTTLICKEKLSTGFIHKSGQGLHLTALCKLPYS